MRKGGRNESLICEQDTILLSADGWKEFQELLRDPPKLNARLKKAFAESARILVPNGPKVPS
jgi:uncharacterized protein (DUF1778 family)